MLAHESSTPAAIIETLENAARLIVPLVREVPADILKRRPQPGKWSAHEHACHLAAVHPLFFTRLALMMSEDDPTIQSYLPDRDDQDGALLAVDLDEALARFIRDRQMLVANLRKLATEDWRRTARHEEYERYSIYIMFRHLALHDFSHAYKIEELMLKRDWR